MFPNEHLGTDILSFLTIYQGCRRRTLCLLFRENIFFRTLELSVRIKFNIKKKKRLGIGVR